ncbi:MAG TPA: phosphotransferase family protein [Candidatus Acidoferrales bacterium]|nr:phosphotransferase family protein [Candidatus Acidoferrales bacterium]
MASLEESLAEYIRLKLPDARDVLVDQLEQISGGASRQTYSFRAAWVEGGNRRERRLILRRDPAASLIDTDRKIEFSAYRAFFKTMVPVPEVLWLEEDSRHLGSPFFIAVEMSGLQSSPARILMEPYAAHHQKIAEQKWTIMGEIAKQDPARLGLVGTMEWVEPDRCWQRELGYWENVLDSDELIPQPIMRAAIRWLRANPPPPAQKISVVHGDFRTGNFLYDEQGKIHGILDWEMAHLGDPLEDLGWSLNRVWCWAHDDRRGGLVPREEAIRIWEKASGLKAAPAAIHWWELFASVKGQGIWVSSAHAWETGENKDPILVLSAWSLMNSQDRAALELMGRLA